MDILYDLMYGGSSSIIGVIVSILVIFFVIGYFKNRGVVHLSLSRFEIDTSNEDNIVIEGRKTGLIQWILVQLKLGNIYKIQVKNTFISYSFMILLPGCL